jgi:hypothetical protein
LKPPTSAKNKQGVNIIKAYQGKKGIFHADSLSPLLSAYFIKA